MYAVIPTGGKQYRVEPGQRLEVERLGARPEGAVELAPVLLVDGGTVLATPDQLRRRHGDRQGRRRGQGPEDQRLHLQAEVQPAEALGPPPAVLVDRDHRDLDG